MWLFLAGSKLETGTKVRETVSSESNPDQLGTIVTKVTVQLSGLSPAIAVWPPTGSFLAGYCTRGLFPRQAVAFGVRVLLLYMVWPGPFVYSDSPIPLLELSCGIPSIAYRARHELAPSSPLPSSPTLPPLNSSHTGLFAFLEHARHSPKVLMAF